jgi:RimJ/RimL family protein N-acetyltransferase
VFPETTLRTRRTLLGPLRAATGNAASVKVALNAGFHREGVLCNAGIIHTGRGDVEVFSLIPADLADDLDHLPHLPL